MWSAGCTPKFARELAVPVGHGKGTLACIIADFLGRTRGEVGGMGQEVTLLGKTSAGHFGRIPMLLGDSVKSDRFKLRDPGTSRFLSK